MAEYETPGTAIREILHEGGELLTMSGDFPGQWDSLSARMDPDDSRKIIVSLFLPDHTKECDDSDDDYECTCEDDDTETVLEITVEVKEIKKVKKIEN